MADLPILLDERRPVSAFRLEVVLEHLAPAKPVAVVRVQRTSSPLQRLGELLSGICFPKKSVELELPKEYPRRWYRVLPTGDTPYFVRPDVGPWNMTLGMARGAIAGESHITCSQSKKFATEAKMRRWHSLPSFIERQVGLEDPPGFECDAFRNCCRICYTAASEVIVMPCRHSSLCEDCLRRMIFSRPAHRGGKNCPFCRTFITEILRVHKDVTIKNDHQYAFTITLD